MELLIRGIAILPGEGDFVPRGYIRLSGERIAAMGPGDGPPDSLSPGVEIRDGTGLVAIPGLINGHTHLSLTRYRGIADDVRLFDFLVETRQRWTRATHEDTFQSALEGCVAAVRSGTTCLVDSHAASPRPAAQAAQEVGLRLVGASSARSLWFGKPAEDTFDACLRETEEVAADFAGSDLLYIPSLAAHSPYNCSGSQITRIKEAARRRGWTFAIHLAECREEVELIRRWQGMTPTWYLESLGVLDDQSLLAHCVFLTDDDMRLLADRGAHIMHCPKSNAKLGSGTAPIPECLAHGIAVSLGTDSMVSNNNLDMVEEMRFCALIHRSVRANPAAVTAKQVFEIATIGGARALGLEDEIGSLRPGKRADLILLSLHPPSGVSEQTVLSELIFHATSEAVRTVIVNGQVLMDDGRVVSSRDRAREPSDA